MSALTFSIDIWKNRLTQTNPHDVMPLGISTCPLCVKHMTKDDEGRYVGCNDCPIALSGHHGCNDTPYATAWILLDIWKKHRYSIKWRDLFRVECQREIDFLESYLLEDAE